MTVNDFDPRRSFLNLIMEKFYCIDYEEGCRTEPCSKCCEKCEGWIARENVNDSKPSKLEPDVDTAKLH